MLAIVLPHFLAAQDFQNAVGIRGGITAGFEYRLYTEEASSYRFLLGTRDNGVQMHVFKEFHQYNQFTFSEQLSFFYGVGVHSGYQRWDVRHQSGNATWYDTRTAFLMGLDGLAGLEYLFYQVPLSIGFEAKPYFDILGRQMFNIELFDFAFTLKYHF